MAPGPSLRFPEFILLGLSISLLYKYRVLNFLFYFVLYFHHLFLPRRKTYLQHISPGVPANHSTVAAAPPPPDPALPSAAAESEKITKSPLTRPPHHQFSVSGQPHPIFFSSSSFPASLPPYRRPPSIKNTSRNALLNRRESIRLHPRRRRRFQ